MSDDRHDMRGYSPDSHEAKAIAALRRLPRAAVDPVARGKARMAFLAAAAGPISGSDPGPVISSAEPPAVDGESRRSGRFGNLMGVIAVMAALLAVAIFGRTPTEEWIVLDVVNPAGVEAPAGSELVKGGRMEPGNIVLAEGTELELQLGDRLRFRMMPGTGLELPEGPGRWFNRDRELTLASGEIYGTTGGNKLGFPLDFQTDELTANLTGTTFAVFRTPEASCVCLWEGGITVTPTAEGAKPTVLPPKRRIWIFKDGRPAEVMPLSDMETMKLQMTADMGLAPAPDANP